MGAEKIGQEKEIRKRKRKRSFMVMVYWLRMPGLGLRAAGWCSKR